MIIMVDNIFNFDEKVEIIDGIWKGQIGLLKGCVKTNDANTLDAFTVYVQTIYDGLVTLKGSQIAKIEKNTPKLFLTIERERDRMFYRGLRVGTSEEEIKSMFLDDNVDVAEITEVQNHTIFLQRK